MGWIKPCRPVRSGPSRRFAAPRAAVRAFVRPPRGHSDRAASSASATSSDAAEGARGLEAYDAYGVAVTREEEKERIRQVVRLLHSGSSLDDAVREGVESGGVDGKTLAVLHRRIHGGETAGGEEGSGGPAMRKALSVLYDKLLAEYQKRNLSPSMRLLGECLDLLLDEGGEGEGQGGETERLLRVKDLLDGSFLRADLGLDPISAAGLFARADADPRLQAQIDGYLDSRMEKDVFVREVEARLDSLRGEFAELDEEEDRLAGEGDWIDGVEMRNTIRAKRAQRERILKYVSYVADLAKNNTF